MGRALLYLYSDNTTIMARTFTDTEQLLTPLTESIVGKPPYISGTLQLPVSYFSLFYKVTKDGHAARFASPSAKGSLTLC